MNAKEILSQASDIVSLERHLVHGDKHKNFPNIALMWNAYLSTRPVRGQPLDAEDVAHMMVLLKIARTKSGLVNIDDYVDGCGYLSIAGELTGAQVDS